MYLQVYVAQTTFKLFLVLLILSYTIPLLNSLSFNHVCRPEEWELVGYATFECVHVLSSLLHKLLVAYLILLGLYTLLNLHTLRWIFHRWIQFIYISEVFQHFLFTFTGPILFFLMHYKLTALVLLGWGCEVL